jgi:hypothetical protein
MTNEDRNHSDTHFNKADHVTNEAKNGKAERDAALKAVTDNMAKLKALRLAREAAEPPRLATAKKTRSKPGTSGKKTSAEKGPALSAWLAGQQSGGRRT